MDSSSWRSDQNNLQVLSPESVPFLEEGISLVLSRWTALQMAVESRWGGPNSRQKLEELASAISSWFINVKESLYIDDLENLLDENMEQSFNTVIEDGSIEEVAEQLMAVHEDLVQGNYASVENLRKSTPVMNALSLSRQAIAHNVGESSEEDEGSNMMVDQPPGTEIQAGTAKPTQVIDEEGWNVVPPRRHKSKPSSQGVF